MWKLSQTHLQGNSDAPILLIVRVTRLNVFVHRMLPRRPSSPLCVLRGVVLSDNPPSVCHTPRQIDQFRAWEGFNLRMTPGIHPKIERRMLMRKSAPQPVLRNTARGGRNMARKYMHISYWVVVSLASGRMKASWRKTMCPGSYGSCWFGETYGR